MLSERMKQLRKANNLTQQELADRIGVSVGAIKHWEQGKGEPNTAMLVSMAVLFNVSCDYLVGRSPIHELAVTDDDIQRVIGVVEELPQPHREALFKYAELLKRGNNDV